MVRQMLYPCWPWLLKTFFSLFSIPCPWCQQRWFETNPQPWNAEASVLPLCCCCWPWLLKLFFLFSIPCPWCQLRWLETNPQPWNAEEVLYPFSTAVSPGCWNLFSYFLSPDASSDGLKQTLNLGILRKCFNPLLLLLALVAENLFYLFSIPCPWCQQRWLETNPWRMMRWVFYNCATTTAPGG